MSNELVVKDKVSEEDKFFKKIQVNYRITDDEKFEKGKEFALLVSEGQSSTMQIYMDVFGVERDVSSKESHRFKHRKWIQELIRYYQFDDVLEYTKETRDTIKVLHNIVLDSRASNREKTEASKALREYIKQDKEAKQQQEDATATDTVNMIGNLVQGIQQLVGSGKMIDKDGGIIDVPILE